jgi:Holliday junction DNA helicase RuvA
MIASLTGRLASKHPGGVVIDVQGVGYDVLIPLSTYYRLPDPDQSVSLTIHTHVREDAIQLFGFLTAREKDAFLLLLTVSGIGPKLALSVISTLSVDDLSGAILNDDYAVLASVPGIGKKSAGRLALELKDKIEKISIGADILTTKPREPSDRLMNDALSALVNLGYKAADVKDVLKQVLAARNGEMPLQDLIRAALKELAK